MSAALRINSVLVTNSLLPLQSCIGHNCCIWYVVVVLLVSAALRSVVTRFLEVHVTHVYNDQIDSVFADPEIRIFGKKQLERSKRQHAYELRPRRRLCLRSSCRFLFNNWRSILLLVGASGLPGIGTILALQGSKGL